MKSNKILRFAMLLTLTGCGPSADKPKLLTIETVSDSVIPESADIETEVIQLAEPTYYEKNFHRIGEEEMIGSKPLKKYLSDIGIPEKFKEIFITDGDSLNSEETSLALIDSIFSDDFERQPFYFVLFTRSMWWADGSFAEPLYIAAKRYAENETPTLLSYLTTEKVISDADYSNWAEGIAMEISISAEGLEKEALQNLRENMLQNTSKQEHAEVEKFIDKIDSHLQ